MKKALGYVARLMAECIIGAALFLMGTGSFDLHLGIFFTVYVAVAAVSSAITYCFCCDIHPNGTGGQNACGRHCGI